MSQSLQCLLLLVSLSSCGVRHGCGREEALWVHAGALVIPDSASATSGHPGIAFSVTAVPIQLAEEIRQHYKASGWRERPVLHRFEWTAWAGGGVLRVAGRPNPKLLSWTGQWQDSVGDTVLYSLHTDTEVNDVLAHISAYVTCAEPGR